MKKVRVFELAREFGMKGPDLAKLLRELGFDNIKTHMTVLDDADLMMVEARLATQGLKRQPADDDAEAGGGLRKKRSLSAVAEEVEDEGSSDAEAKGGEPKKRLLKKKSLPAPAARRAAEPPAEAPPAAEPKSLPKPAAEPAAAMSQDGTGAAMEREPATPVQAEPKPTLGKVETTAAQATPPAAEAKVAESKPVEPRPVEHKTGEQKTGEQKTGEQKPVVATPVEAKAAEPTAAEAKAAETKVDAPRAAATPATEPVRATADAPKPAAPAGDDQGSTAETVAFPAPKGAIAPQPADGGGDATAEAPTKDPVRKLLVPQKKATVVGRIELPQETIRDATRRSAPAAPRDLRRAALQKMQQRGAVRQVPLPGQRRGPGGRGGRDGQRGPGRGKSRTAAPVDPSKLVEVQEPVSMKALSEALGIKVNELIAAFMFKLKIPGKNINSMLTNDEVELVALELNRNIRVVAAKEAMDELLDQLVEANEGQETALRAPVVTFMGHVDHGKTSLMDALRHSDVTKHEAGGITQHIGAYKITSDEGLSIVVLDTPGHAAFTAMRARGAELTDVVVLVVAADDGVMPQTEEAISHAKAAGVPIVVAVTKCDLPGANPMQVKQQLMIKGLQSEDFGGEIGVVEVSSKTGQGLSDLVERIHLEAEILDLNARPDAAGKGVVVEARQSAEQGVVVTLLVTDGTLRLKDQVVCGESFARIRAMIDDHGKSLVEAGPSTPVTLFGLDRLPTPGDKLYVVEDAKKAKEVVEERQRRMREMSRAERSAVTLETLSAKLAERDIKEIKLILKADAMGSLEPLRKCLDDLATEEVRVNLVHSGLGGINKADVDLAATSGAVIVGFNTTADANVRALADEQGVDIRYYDVIYELLDQVKDAMEGVLAPEEVQSVIGHAEVRATFKSSKFGVIAGCRVTDGIIRRSAQVRLARDGKVLWSGKLASLRRIDEDVKDVKAGFECGMTLDGFQDLKEGDVLEFVHTELVKRTLGG